MLPVITELCVAYCILSLMANQHRYKFGVSAISGREKPFNQLKRVRSIYLLDLVKLTFSFIETFNRY